MRYIEILVSALLVLLSFALLPLLSVARADQKVPSYRPATPTLSPYLYLTQPTNGIFPNYQAYVQPLEAQQQANQVQQIQISQLQQGQQKLQQQQLYQPGKVAPTGVNAGFNSLSHFYPVASPPRGKSGKR
jgi:DNA-binding beta-propeller fold protein YncE